MSSCLLCTGAKLVLALFNATVLIGSKSALLYWYCIAVALARRSPLAVYHSFLYLLFQIFLWRRSSS